MKESKKKNNTGLRPFCVFLLFGNNYPTVVKCMYALRIPLWLVHVLLLCAILSP